MSNRVLILDDERLIVSLLQKLLERDGMETTACERGEEAVAKVEEAREAGAPYSLLIMDLSLPAAELDGLQAIRKIRDIDPDVPAIATSGFPEESDTAKKAGFTEFVAKPFDLAALRHQIQALSSARS